jgi:hypothetical protein
MKNMAIGLFLIFLLSWLFAMGVLLKTDGLVHLLFAAAILSLIVHVFSVERPNKISQVHRIPVGSPLAIAHDAHGLNERSTEGADTPTRWHG